MSLKVVVRLVSVAAVALCALLMTAGGASAAGRHHDAPPDLGPNVKIFDPSMSTSAIQATVDAIAAQQLSNQFGTQRYALLFMPGTYGSASQPLIFQVGYYTEVAGLGASPNDVTINGAIDVHNQCDASGCTALDNFWRSMSNLTIHVAGQTGCRSATEFWAVSQAAPLRRVAVTGGKLSLMDYCTAGPQYASGGFIADSSFPDGAVVNGSQQQFFVRNSVLGGWSNAVWNQVFAGDVGAPPQSFPSPPYTTLPRTPQSREKPFLYVDRDGALRVSVPGARTNSQGTSWSAGTPAGRSLALSDFFVARPSDSARLIDTELARGRNVLFTPGVYNLDRTIDVKRPDTVVLGLGLPTLTAERGVVAMRTADVPGVDIAGLMIDAGPVESPVLLQIGSRHAHKSSAADPTAIQDVFFRIGGAH